MTDTVVAEGQVKFRDGKKWKTRWVVLRKPSPVADCLFLLAYKKEKKKGKKGIGQKESLTLEGICGVEPGPGFDGVSYSLSVLCLSHTLVLGFSNREALLAWDARIRFHLGEVHRFSVTVEPGSKLESGPASLHLCNSLLVLTSGLPPMVTGHWKLSALRRYGAVPNGFVFEGGTRCGYWAGVFYLSSSEGEQISFLVDCIVRGIGLNRTPQGLRPGNPADANPVSAEERILQETSDLEKRLSRLSNCSLASSTASTFSCSTSVAGDDHNSISSSSSSQSEASYGPRLPFWPESLSRLHSSIDTASSSSTLKALTASDDRLYAAATGNAGTRPSSAQLHSRGLHDSGRQSSLDSGIGIAASSQSSGSFSSYTGSLDAAVAQGGEEFGSAPSLALPQALAAAPLTPPPPPPTEAPVTPVTPVPDSAPSTCPSSRCSTRISQTHSDEYHIPSMLKLRYDTPRSLLSLRDTIPNPSSEPGQNTSNTEDFWWHGGPPKVKDQCTKSWGSERQSTNRPQSVPACTLSGKTQCGHASDNYITSEQWRAVGNTSSKKVEKSASARTTHICKPDEQNYGALGNMLARLKLSMPSSPPPAPLAVPTRPATACGMLRQDSKAAPSTFLDPSLYLHNTVHYVNLPFSAMLANRDLLCSSPAAVSSLQVVHRVLRPEEGSTSAIAHLNPGAMETAQRGAESVQGRGARPWDRLIQSRRPGTPQ
ncbi:protein Dok-7 [Boleophthalmus pectinirostris]|uniref:protein Dok-7 n=1 Tax=Boleophthalmus pectinirostris TaxID=150288 RepID=UPI00242DF273|nr:protein Dok-7 [Boleophthalmus pectinirostris]